MPKTEVQKHTTWKLQVQKHASMRSARRSRSKARKPRYVSLRRHLAPVHPDPPSPPPVLSDMSSTAVAHRRHQLDLFPLHPEPLDVACLLDDRGAVGEPTLAAILGGGDSSSPESPSLASLPSPSINWQRDGAGGDGLARRALRGRERWAFWRASSGPAAGTSSEEEVVSSATGGVDLWRCAAATRALALKLDYEKILAAWSDRGPLYMDADAPQIVPQLCHSGDPYDFAAFPVLVEVGQGGGDAASAWKVPEKVDAEGREVDGEEEDGRSVIISREARVRRYKEKRGNRRFAKRIRYEVRKMNAEKRPRVKGRFVKKKDEDEDEDEDQS